MCQMFSGHKLGGGPAGGAEARMPLVLYEWEKSRAEWEPSKGQQAGWEGNVKIFIKSSFKKKNVSLTAQ